MMEGVGSVIGVSQPSASQSSALLTKAGHMAKHRAEVGRDFDVIQQRIQIQKR
jgi:hypothetical protein